MTKYLAVEILKTIDLTNCENYGINVEKNDVIPKRETIIEGLKKYAKEKDPSIVCQHLKWITNDAGYWGLEFPWRIIYEVEIPSDCKEDIYPKDYVESIDVSPDFGLEPGQARVFRCKLLSKNLQNLEVKGKFQVIFKSVVTDKNNTESWWDIWFEK